MINASKYDLIKIISRLGKKWGITYSKSPFDGSILAAEEIPSKIRLGNGISVVERVKRPICEISNTYPFSFLLRNRLRKAVRKKWLGLELKRFYEEKEANDRMEPVLHQMKSDILDLKKGKLIIGGR
jgi:hypothetical protein